MASYDRLTALDSSFLHLERLEYPMHVGALSASGFLATTLALGWEMLTP